ncbi:MAG: hypothetical protein FJX78_02230 [Armatimonadetes bacterium]|nr:hypothetical protein [Armatimonadota bacterium]
MSPVWLQSVPGILAIHHECWGTSPTLRPPCTLAAIVFVQGFDMPISDDERALHFLPTFRRIAESLGLRSIFIRTNVRENPYFNSISWERTHCAALTAIGHLLANEYGRLVIPSSSTLDDVGLWGSHWRTDPLWKSGSVDFLHHDPAIHRNDKIRLIAHEPLLWKSLLVCWENRTAHSNCSACEKCAKTMVLLSACGQLENYEVFDLSVPLARRIEDLPRAPVHMIHVWAHVLELDLPSKVKEAIRRLILRSRWALLVEAAKSAVRCLRSRVLYFLQRRLSVRNRSI